MYLRRKPPKGNVRRVRSMGKNIPGVTATKRGEIAQFESTGERKLLLLLDRDPRVVSYRTQPFTIEFKDEVGKQRTYTPDVLVKLRDGCVEVHEVSTLSNRLSVDGRRREQAGSDYCSSRGWRYVAHTEEDLLSKALHANLAGLFGFRATCYGDKRLKQAILDLLESGPRPLSKVASELSSSLGLAPGEIRAVVYHLLWHGTIATDLERLIFPSDWYSADPVLRLVSKG